MEANVKEKKQTSTSRVWKFVKEDHKFDNWLLFILSLFLLVISILILSGAVSETNTFAKEYFDISKSGWAVFDAKWKIIVITSVIIAVSAASIVYSLWPVFVPSFKELKFVTWTSKRDLFINSITVLVFIAFLTVLFYALDLGLVPLFRLIFGE